ncbi:hypothetical protein Tco_0847150 [Tanacetum coccineum]
MILPLLRWDDTRNLDSLLEAPTMGYEDAIVVPEITVDNFELKHGFLTLGVTQIWLKKNPSIGFTWEILVSRNSSTNLSLPPKQQIFEMKSRDFNNDLMKLSMSHETNSMIFFWHAHIIGFSELHQLDTFYNALNSNDQDSLNSAAGGNFLDKMPRDCLRIIESKSKVRNSRNKPVVAKVSSRKVVLLAVELILTEIVPPLMATFIVTIFKSELTLHVGKEAIKFNLDQTSRYSSNYNDNSVNRIDVIEMAYEEYSQEVLGFSDVIASGNPTPYYNPIVSTSSSTLTPFGDSDFLLEEVDAFLAPEDDPTSPEVDYSYYYPEGDILLLESFLNDDPSLPPPT